MNNVVTIVEIKTDFKLLTEPNPNLSLEQIIEQATLLIIHQYVLMPGCYLTKDANNRATIYVNGTMLPIALAIKVEIIKELEAPIVLDSYTRKNFG